MELGIEICAALTGILSIAEIFINGYLHYSLFGLIGTLLLIIINLIESED